MKQNEMPCINNIPFDKASDPDFNFERYVTEHWDECCQEINEFDKKMGIERINTWRTNIGVNVDHPKHYNMHPSGVECIEIARHYCFDIGNAIKYLWRAGLKTEEGMTDRAKEIEDLKKAVWYIEDYIKTIESKEL